MKILIATAGSRGDVQPYVALALGLMASGHEVSIATDALFEPFIRQRGIEFYHLSANPQEALREDLSRIGNNPIKFMGWLNRHLIPKARQGFLDLIKATSGIDAMIYSSLMFLAPHVAGGIGIPALAAFLQPATPTRSFPALTVNELPEWFLFRGWYNWNSTRLTNQILFLLTKGVINQCRQEFLNLSPWPWRNFSGLDISNYPILYAFSPSALPKPDDWGDWLHICGYWFLEKKQDFIPPAELLAFLESGPTPVYIGFGSMTDREDESCARLVFDAINEAGVRAIILGGWARQVSRELPEGVLQIDNVPHDWLFPQMATIIHHGGAGTTATAMWAGIPEIVIPYFGDQPFWGRRVTQLGVGPPPIPRKKLTAPILAKAIKRAISEDYFQERASDLGQRIRAEDGIAKAVILVEKYLCNPKSRLPHYPAPYSPH